MPGLLRTPNQLESHHAHRTFCVCHGVNVGVQSGGVSGWRAPSRSPKPASEPTPHASTRSNGADDRQARPSMGKPLRGASMRPASP